MLEEQDLGNLWEGLSECLWLNMKRMVPVGPPRGSRACSCQSLVGGGVWRQWVGMHSRAGANARVGKVPCFYPVLGSLPPQLPGTSMFGVVLCVYVCVCLILEWIMTCEENNNHSDLYSKPVHVSFST